MTPRTLAPAAAPLGLAIVLAWHPTDPTRAVELADQLTRWFTVHIGLLLLLPLVALSLARMLDSLDGRAARVASRLLVPAVALYAAFDALVGIGTGLIVQQATRLPDELRDGALALAEAWWSIPPVTAAIATAGVITWTTTVATTALAMHRSGHTVPAVAVLISSVLFAAGHPGTTGALAMIALAIGIATFGATSRRQVSGRHLAWR